MAIASSVPTCSATSSPFSKVATGKLIELDVANPLVYQKLLDKIQFQSIDLLNSQEFSPIVYEDLHELVKTNLVPLLCASDGSSASQQVGSLLEIFNEQECSNGIVMFFRFVTSAWLKKNRERFENFINRDEYSSYDAFLRATESLDREVDQIVLVALNEWMEGCCKVLIMDNSPSSKFTASKDELFLEFTGPDSEGQEISVHVNLLYKPGHYELFYFE